MNGFVEATPVVTQTGAWIATGAWGTFLTSLALLLKLVAAQWLPWLRLRSDNANERRKEQRTDLSDCKDRIDKMQVELNGVKNHVHNLEMKLVGAISAYRVLDAEVEAARPDQPLWCKRDLS